MTRDLEREGFKNVGYEFSGLWVSANELHVVTVCSSASETMLGRRDLNILKLFKPVLSWTLLQVLDFSYFADLALADIISSIGISVDDTLKEEHEYPIEVQVIPHLT